MRRRFNCDRQWLQLVESSPSLGALPRQSVYGSAPGLIPFGEAYPDALIKPADYKAVIQFCHDRMVFPLYHQQDSWAPKGKKWNQNGLNYCWAWGATAAMMDLRAREGKPTIELAPVSLGWLVGWSNKGYFLDETLAGIAKRGIAPASCVPDPHDPVPRYFAEDWEQQALQYRLGEKWDTDNSRSATMIQHCISILHTGTPPYVAYNWWGHALELVALEWDESEANNLVWILRNSHNEDDVIELTGSRAVPSEAYGLRASLT